MLLLLSPHCTNHCAFWFCKYWARSILLKYKSDHFTPPLKTFQWLSLSLRVKTRSLQWSIVSCLIQPFCCLFNLILINSLDPTKTVIACHPLFIDETETQSWMIDLRLKGQHMVYKMGTQVTTLQHYSMSLTRKQLDFHWRILRSLRNLWYCVLLNMGDECGLKTGEFIECLIKIPHTILHR